LKEFGSGNYFNTRTQDLKYYLEGESNVQKEILTKTLSGNTVQSILDYVDYVFCIFLCYEQVFTYEFFDWRWFNEYQDAIKFHFLYTL